jgi:hypothetical protein
VKQEERRSEGLTPPWENVSMSSRPAILERREEDFIPLMATSSTSRASVSRKVKTTIICNFHLK